MAEVPPFRKRRKENGPAQFSGQRTERAVHSKWCGRCGVTVRESVANAAQCEPPSDPIWAMNLGTGYADYTSPGFCREPSRGWTAPPAIISSRRRCFVRQFFPRTKHCRGNQAAQARSPFADQRPVQRRLRRRLGLLEVRRGCRQGGCGSSSWTPVATTPLPTG